MLVAAFGSERTAILSLEQWSHQDHFDTSAAYQHFRRRASPVIWHKQIWCPAALPKFSFTGWLAARGRLLTRDRLHGQVTSLDCLLCGTSPETHAHLFFGCPFTSVVWDHVKHWCGIRRAMTTYASALKWLKKDFSGPSWKDQTRRLAFLCTVYYIWETRNSKLFRLSPVDPLLLVRRIKTSVYRIMFSLYPNVLHQFECLALGS